LSGNRLVSVQGAEGFAPLGLDVTRQDGDDVIYFTGRDPKDGVMGVFQIHANGSQPAAVVWKGSPLAQPDSVTVAGNGIVYVSDRAAGGNGLGSVFSISDTTISRIATGFRPGTPAGIALDRSEAWLFVSSLDSQQTTAQVLIIDLETFASGTANKGIGQNHAAGGLHRAHDANVFAWANSTPGGGEVYHVPIPPPKPPKKP
jgi:sugar lactone lactonase YvrE